jgi:superfamily I DNA and/or RNA helicase
VVVSTFHAAFLGSGPEGGFDAVLVDEAGASALPLAYLAAGLARGRVAYYGDFQQLGPVVKSQESLVATWYRPSVFEAHDIPALVERDEAAPHFVALTQQYRMAAPIMQLVSKFSYMDRLVRPVEAPRIAVPSGISMERVVGIELPRGTEAERDGRSRRNPTSARVVLSLLRDLARCSTPHARADTIPVAVITPFRAQTRLLRSECDDLVTSMGGIITTIHRLQGREADVVILDLVAGSEAPVPTQSLGARVLTVALSRARAQLIIVGAFTDLQRMAPQPSALARLLGCLRDHEVQLLPAGDFLPLLYHHAAH